MKKSFLVIPALVLCVSCTTKTAIVSEDVQDTVIARSILVDKVPDDNLEKKQRVLVNKALNEHLESKEGDLISEEGYDVSFVDLNGDDLQEAILLMNHKAGGFVGMGGSTMFILEGVHSGYSCVSRSTITRKPIYVRVAKHKGWHDIVVHVAGGAKSSYRLMSFDGKSYPGNPSSEPEATINESDVLIMKK